MLLSILVVSIVIVLDSITLFAAKKQKKTGIETPSPSVSIDGSDTLPVRNYVSQIQGLAGRPDAVILEQGYFIPVERKPLARKIRDRYVAQVLVYMRLIEEFEGKKPPHGYLILGPNCRKFKIENSEDRQRWLQTRLDQMRAYLEEGEQVTADPHPRKCRKCTVKNVCEYREDAPEE